MSAIDNPANWGRFVKEDGNTVNFADILQTVFQHKSIVDVSIESEALLDGKSFAAGYVWNNVANLAFCVLHLFTGAQPCLTSFNVQATGLTDYGAYLDPTLTGNGTSVDVVARNLNTDLVALARVYRDPTYSNIGTIQIPRFLGGGANPAKATGGDVFERILILEPNTHYIFAAKNSAGAVQDRMGITVDWIEMYNQ